jgi:hypothetical protein
LADDAPHAFYMGVELAKAQIALQLGKRYEQDAALNWYAATDASDTNVDAVHAFKTPGTTLAAKAQKKNQSQ